MCIIIFHKRSPHAISNILINLLSFFQLLLDAGYPTDTKNKFGCTALYIAAMRGMEGCVPHCLSLQNRHTILVW